MGDISCCYKSRTNLQKKQDDTLQTTNIINKTLDITSLTELNKILQHNKVDLTNAQKKSQDLFKELENNDSQLEYCKKLVRITSVIQLILQDSIENEILIESQQMNNNKLIKKHNLIGGKYNPTMDKNIELLRELKEELQDKFKLLNTENIKHIDIALIKESEAYSYAPLNNIQRFYQAILSQEKIKYELSDPFIAKIEMMDVEFDFDVQETENKQLYFKWIEFNKDNLMSVIKGEWNNDLYTEVCNKLNIDVSTKQSSLNSTKVRSPVRYSIDNGQINSSLNSTKVSTPNRHSINVNRQDDNKNT